MRKETGKKAGAALLAAMMAVSALGGTVTGPGRGRRTEDDSDPRH